MPTATSKRTTQSTATPVAQVISERVPPQNLDAERSVLGALLLDRDAVIKIAESLRAEHFYREIHGLIYAAILRLFEAREPADLITLSNELNRFGHLERVGGDGYLAELAAGVPTAAHIEHYAGIVKENFTRRQLITTASKVTELSFETGQPIDQILDHAEQTLFSISQDHLKQNFTSLQTTLAENFDRLEELHKNKGKIRAKRKWLRG